MVGGRDREDHSKHLPETLDRPMHILESQESCGCRQVGHRVRENRMSPQSHQERPWCQEFAQGSTAIGIGAGEKFSRLEAGECAV